MTVVLNKPVNPDSHALIGGGAVVIVPAGSCGIEIENFSSEESAADFILTFPKGNKLLVKVGTTKSFGVSTSLCEIKITCPAGSLGQVSWL